MTLIHLAGGAIFDTTTGELRRGGTLVRLEPQPAAVLRRLVSSEGELVSHDELRRVVWGDTTHVKVPDALHYCIRQIRQALDDVAREPRYIETIPRRGYRLKAGCIVPDECGSRSVVARPQRRAAVWGFRLAALALLVAAAIAIEQRPNNHHEITIQVLTAVHTLLF